MKRLIPIFVVGLYHSWANEVTSWAQAISRRL